MNHAARICISLFFSMATAGSVLSAAAASDQASESTPGATVFTADDFSQYAPRTALQMVARIPGFAIQGDDDGSRGFGQAQGNVLIDGQRVTGKSNGAEAALGRIPASAIVRIELVDGSRFDIPGLSGQVVNVVTNGKGTTSGTWRWKSRFRDNLPPYYNQVNLSFSGGRGPLDWSFELDSAPERGGTNGPEYITNGSGALIETRHEDANHIAENVSVSGSLAWKPASGAIGNLNASAGVFEPNFKEVSKTYPVNGTEGRRLFQQSEDEWNLEIGADYEFDLGPGRLKSIALVRRENSPVSNRFTEGRVDGTDVSSSIFNQTVDEGEYILRGEYAFGTRPGHDWQFALEGAFNYLDAKSDLLTSRDGGAFVAEALATSNSRVEEQRAEFAITHNHRVTRTLNGQASIGMEVSELSQSGDAANVRTFTRPKGYVSLTWQADDSLKLVTRLEREVGQLDFFDFISSVNLNAGNGQSGNPDIVPEQSWVLKLQAEKDFGSWGAATVEAFAADIEDIVDRVPIGPGDGPGNLDTAWKIGGEVDATVKLDNIGFAGAEWAAFGEWYDSEVTDPLTGEKRPINGDLVYYYNYELRQDIPQTDWAWGIGFESSKQNANYNLREVGRFSPVPGFGYAYVKHKDVWGMTAQATFGNWANQNEKYRRQLYDTNRLGNVVRVEDRSRDFGPIFTFQLEGTF